MNGGHDFPLDPALFGETPHAGPSNLKKQSTAAASGSETSEESEEEDDSDDDDEDEDESEEEESDESGEEQQPIPSKDKGKGKAKATPIYPGTGLDETGEGDEDDELSRLISAMRVPQIGSAADMSVRGGAFSQAWDQTTEEALAELDEELDVNNKTKRSIRMRRSRADIVPSQEVTALLSKANMHYIMQEHNEAMSILQEVIRIEPAVSAAWNTLAAIHGEAGNHEKALQVSIIAAHLSGRAPELWKELAVRSRELNLSNQAIYCYSQAVKADRKDVDTLWDRAALYHEIGKHRLAANGFEAILKLHPHDALTLRTLVPILLQLKEKEKAYQLLQNAFQHAQKHYSAGPVDGALEVQDLCLLTDLMKGRNSWHDIMDTLKTGARWLQGRLEQGQIWMRFRDDREFDTERKTRPGWDKEEQLIVLENLPVYYLEPELRATLLIGRLAVKEMDEAKRHLAIIQELDVYDYPSIYGEIADAFFDARQYEDALQLYTDMAECDLTNTTDVIFRIGRCNKSLGNNEAAAECFDNVIQQEPDNMNARLQQAEVFEALGRRDEAMDLVNGVLEKRRQGRQAKKAARQAAAMTDGDQPMDQIDQPVDEGGDTPDEDETPVEKKYRKRMQRNPRPSKSKLSLEEKLENERLREAEYEAIKRKLESIEPDMEAGDMNATWEWLDLAGTLLDGFRETKALFPTDGKSKFKGMIRTKKKKKAAQDVDEEANDILDRMEDDMEDEDSDGGQAEYSNSFRGISFDDWLSLALRYGRALTCVGDFTEADAMIKHLLTAAVFKTELPRLRALRFGLVSFAMHAEKWDIVSEELRKVILKQSLQTDPLRLLAACLLNNNASANTLSSANLQKFILRQIKMLDKRVVDIKAGRGESRQPESDEDEEEFLSFKPNKSNPHFFSFYGQGLLASKSYQPSIYYLLRAHEAAPDDMLNNLLCGIAYLHRAMQRQTDNRQHQISQALAFFDRYRKLRGGPSVEVEHNMGRMFHHLGIVNLAVRHYQRALELDIAEPSTADQALKRTAAFNLSQIYLTTGSLPLAKKLAYKWLSF